MRPNSYPPCVWGSGGTLLFSLPLADSGAGAANLVPPVAAGSPTPTFTRATTATTFDVNGTSPISVASGVARSYYDPVLHDYRGYLVEEARTNLLINSTIDGANLATQSVTVTAQPYTLSFYGSGTVTLSGAATGAKVGTAVYPVRSTFTFTPTAGTLTLTVTGTVQYANLEAGAFATSFIPTAGATATRNADVLTYPTSGNVNAAAMTLAAEITTNITTASFAMIVDCSAGGHGALGYIDQTSGKLSSVGVGASLNGTPFSPPQTSVQKVAIVSSAEGVATFLNGGSKVSTATATEPYTLDTNFSIGVRLPAAFSLNGTIKNVRVWSVALSDALVAGL